MLDARKYGASLQLSFVNTANNAIGKVNLIANSPSLSETKVTPLPFRSMIRCLTRVE